MLYALEVHTHINFFLSYPNCCFFTKWPFRHLEQILILLFLCNRCRNNITMFISQPYCCILMSS